MFGSLSGRFFNFLAALVERFHRGRLSRSRAAIAPRKSPSQVTVIREGIGAGLKFAADNTDPSYLAGTYELPIQRALADYLKPGATFYDIGASRGFFTLIAAKLVRSSGRVYAFEPVPENAARIQHNAQLNDFTNVTVLEAAVAAADGRAELLLARHAGGATLATAGTPPDFKGRLDVSLVSIDRLIASQQIQPPTVVKIDVEGAEIDALRGMSQTLAVHKPILIYEVDDGDRATFQQKSETVESFIRNCGYQIVPLEKAYATQSWHVGHGLALPIEQS